MHSKNLFTFLIMSEPFYYHYTISYSVKSAFMLLVKYSLEKNQFIFLEKLVFDSFLDIFLFIYLLLSKITEGKK